MATAYPRVYADDRGVWREDAPGRPRGIRRDEIAGVGGYKLDGITLSVEERAGLEQLVSAGKAAARRSTHARVLLPAKTA